MNLGENYRRFFKEKLEDKKDENISLNESQMNRFANLSRSLAQKYPRAPLTLKNGFVWMGNKKVERADNCLKRSGLAIQEMVRVFSNSGKIGLI